MALPRATTDFLQEIERMEKEIAMYKSNVQMNVQKCMEVQRSIEEVKMLQDKARFLMKCNESKWKKYREEMAEIEKSLLGSEDARTIGCNVAFKGLVGKIEKIKETKIKLEDDVNDRFWKRKSGGAESTLLELPNNYERIKEEYNLGNMKSET